MTKDDLRWQAIQACDVRTAGTFVYRRKADDLYHSPICRNRPANRDDILFFDTPDDAREHGFKACSECYPDQAAWQDQPGISAVYFAQLPDCGGTSET